MEKIFKRDSDKKKKKKSNMEVKGNKQKRGSFFCIQNLVANEVCGKKCTRQWTCSTEKKKQQKQLHKNGEVSGKNATHII